MAFAQAGLIPGANDPSKADLKVLNSEGRLAHIVVTPQDKTLDYYVVGEKEGEINFNNLRLFSGQMNPSSAPTERPQHKTQARAQAQTGPVTRHEVQPTIILRPRRVRHNVSSRQVVKIPLAHVKPASVTAIHGQRRSGYPDMSWLLLLLLLLCIALYAHRTSLKVRSRQSARVF